MQQHSKSKVCYYYDSDIGNYYYGQVATNFSRVKFKAGLLFKTMFRRVTL